MDLLKKQKNNNTKVYTNVSISIASGGDGLIFDLFVKPTNYLVLWAWRKVEEGPFFTVFCFPGGSLESHCENNPWKQA